MLIDAHGKGQMTIRRWMLWVLVALVILTVGCKIIPFSPLMPTMGLDEAWHVAMNQAVAAHMSLGRDIIFTFGPYVFLYTRTYQPLIDHLMMGGAIYLALTYAFALILLLRGAGFIQMAGLWLAIVAPSLSDNLFYLYPLLVGLVLWSLSDSQAKVPRSAWQLWWLPFVLCFPFGMLSLIKGSFAIICVMVAGLSVGFLVMRRMFVSATAIAIALVVSIIFFWVLAGQAIGDLAAYLHSMGEIAGGYTDAMSTSGSAWEVLVYVGAAALVMLHVLLGNWGGACARLYVLGLFAIYLFLALKSGFVRHDGHCLISASAVLLAAAMVVVQRKSSIAVLSFLITAVAYAFIVHGYASLKLRDLSRDVGAIYSSAWQGIGDRLAPGGPLKARYEQSMKALADNAHLPKLDGGTDLYSLGQSYLIASGSAWDPRPVIQSYSAFTPWLARANREHLFGQKAPQNIWFKIEPIDGRLPSLEDGASWPVLLGRYQLAGIHDDYLLLKRREQIVGADAELGSLAPAVYRFGRSISVPAGDDPMIAEVDIKPSFIGKLADVLFKRRPLSITVHLENGEMRNYRIIAKMAESGFLISPLVEDTKDFGMLYGGSDLLKQKKVVSFVIHRLGGQMEWEPSFSVSFRKLHLPHAQNVKSMLGVRPPIQVSQSVTSASGCEGSIDLINGQAPSSSVMKASGWLSVLGWMAKSVDQAEVPPSLVLVLTNANGQNTYFQAQRKPRPDVAAYFKRPALEMAGYDAVIDVAGLEGEYTMGLGYIEGRDIELCPLPKARLNIGG